MEIKIIKVGICNCYIIKDEGTILIDTGMPGKCKQFSKGLKKVGINPKEIKAIVITHCHFDHIGCIKEIKNMTNAKVIAHKHAKTVIEKGEIVMPPGVTMWGKILAVLLKKLSKMLSIEPVEVDIVVGEEDYSLEEFGINGKIVFTPGHSHGSVSIVMDTGDTFVGDMAMNGTPLTMGPNLAIFAEDIDALKNSWKKLIDMRVKKIYPAHGKSFPIEKLKKKI